MIIYLFSFFHTDIINQFYTFYPNMNGKSQPWPNGKQLAWGREWGKFVFLKN